jgi:hypothetical protein
MQTRSQARRCRAENSTVSKLRTRNANCWFNWFGEGDQENRNLPVL